MHDSCMPVVSVRYKSHVPQQAMADFLPALCDKLAEQLTCELDGKQLVITPKMVKVRFDQASELDTDMSDLHVEIEARAFEARLGHQQAYATEIADLILPFLPKGVKISVWYKLFPAGWSAGQAQ